MRIALDTNAYSLFARGDDKGIIEIFRTTEQIFFPFVALAELRAGFRSGYRMMENEKELTRFLNQYQVSVLFADEQSTHYYATLHFQLRKQGTSIPTTDLWIATLVVQHDLVLCSRDKHFDALPQIPRV